jgi:hypothetical protein
MTSLADWRNASRKLDDDSNRVDKAPFRHFPPATLRSFEMRQGQSIKIQLYTSCLNKLFLLSLLNLSLRALDQLSYNYKGQLMD